MRGKLGKSVKFCEIWSEKVLFFVKYTRKKCQCSDISFGKSVFFFASHGKDTWLLLGYEVEVRKIKVAGG